METESIMKKIDGFVDSSIKEFKDKPFATGIKLFIAYIVLKALLGKK